MAKPAAYDGRGTECITAIFVDLCLPDSQGIATFDRLFAAARDIPILILRCIAGRRYGEIDDFGTGYASLSFLKRFPIHTLKIDHSFVRDLATDSEDASIVSAVVDMGRNLNMQVVAEGVETREQCTFLKRHNCPEAQGFYFGKPMLPKAVARLFADAQLQFDNRARHSAWGTAGVFSVKDNLTVRL